MRIQYNKNDGADERRNLMDKKIQRIDRIADKKKKFVQDSRKRAQKK